jgi:hypothetical protein
MKRNKRKKSTLSRIIFTASTGPIVEKISKSNGSVIRGSRFPTYLTKRQANNQTVNKRTNRKKGLKGHTNSEIVRLDDLKSLVAISFVLSLFRLAEMWTEIMETKF